MKICVTASEKSLDAQLDPRFGRCRYFLIVDPETLEFEAVSNVAASAMHGAGIQRAHAEGPKEYKKRLEGNSDLNIRIKTIKRYDRK